MIISIPNYIKGYRIVSLAKDEETRDMIIKENLPCIFVAENIATFYPECITVSLDEGTANKFASCCNYDVFEIKDDGGAYLYYNNASEDNAILITNKCNSNCIMCPSPEASRKGGSIGEIENLLENLFIYDGSSQAFSAENRYLMRDSKNYVFTPTSLYIFVVTTDCNMRCSYCQAHTEKSLPKYMDIATAEKAVDIALSSPSNVRLDTKENCISLSQHFNAVYSTICLIVLKFKSGSPP